MGLAWRLCATHGFHELCRDRSRGRTASQALWSCCPSVSLPQRAPAQPQPPGPSRPTLSHCYPASDPSTAFGLCPASQFNFLQELTCCLLPSSRSSIKMLNKFKPRQGLSRPLPPSWHSLPFHWHGSSFWFWFRSLRQGRDPIRRNFFKSDFPRCSVKWFNSI